MKVYRQTNSFYKSNSYILYNNSENAFIIDCGDADKLLSWLKRNNKILSGIILTHTHFDHIYGLNNFLRVYKNIKVYTSEFGKDALFDTKKNFSHYHEENFKFDGSNIEILKDGDSVSLWDDIKLFVIETKGHDKSCLTYSVDNYLFTGDSYIPGVKVITSLPNSNKEEATRSEKLILSLITDNTFLCPGHGEITLGNQII